MFFCNTLYFAFVFPDPPPHARIRGPSQVRVLSLVRKTLLEEAA